MWFPRTTGTQRQVCRLYRSRWELSEIHEILMAVFQQQNVPTSPGICSWETSNPSRTNPGRIETSPIWSVPSTKAALAQTDRECLPFCAYGLCNSHQLKLHKLVSSLLRLTSLTESTSFPSRSFHNRSVFKDASPPDKAASPLPSASEGERCTGLAVSMPTCMFSTITVCVQW